MRFRTAIIRTILSRYSVKDNEHTINVSHKKIMFTGCNDCRAVQSSPSDVARAGSKSLFGTPVCLNCYQKYYWKRTRSFAIDMVIGMVLLLLALGCLWEVGSRLDPTLKENTNGQMGNLIAILGFLIWAAYWLVRDAGAGSIGKRLNGLLVVDQRSELRVTMLASIKRNLPVLGYQFILPLFPPLTIPIGYKILFKDNGEGRADRFAGTRVVIKQYKDHPPFKG